MYSGRHGYLIPAYIIKRKKNTLSLASEFSEAHECFKKHALQTDIKISKM